MKKSDLKPNSGSLLVDRRRLELEYKCFGTSHTSKDCPVLLALENTLNTIAAISEMEKMFFRFVDNSGDDEAKAQLHSCAQKLDATFWRLCLSFCEWLNKRFSRSGKFCYCNAVFMQGFESCLADAKANLDKNGGNQHGI